MRSRKLHCFLRCLKGGWSSLRTTLGGEITSTRAVAGLQLPLDDHRTARARFGILQTCLAREVRRFHSRTAPQDKFSPNRTFKRATATPGKHSSTGSCALTFLELGEAVVLLSSCPRSCPPVARLRFLIQLGSFGMKVYGANMWLWRRDQSGCLGRS